jgi:hypothetical protein
MVLANREPAGPPPITTTLAFSAAAAIAGAGRSLPRARPTQLTNSLTRRPAHAALLTKQLASAKVAALEEWVPTAGDSTRVLDRGDGTVERHGANLYHLPFECQ